MTRPMLWELLRAAYTFQGCVHRARRLILDLDTHAAPLDVARARKLVFDHVTHQYQQLAQDLERALLERPAAPPTPDPAVHARTQAPTPHSPPTAPSDPGALGDHGPLPQAEKAPASARD